MTHVPYFLIQTKGNYLKICVVNRLNKSFTFHATQNAQSHGLYPINHTWNYDWNYPVVNKAMTGAIDLPSTVQSITPFSSNHWIIVWDAHFWGNHDAQRVGMDVQIWKWAVLVWTSLEEIDVLQHKVFLLITQVDTNSYQEPSHFPNWTHQTGHPLLMHGRPYIFVLGAPCWHSSNNIENRRSPIPFFVCKSALWVQTVRYVLSGDTSPASARGMSPLDGFHYNLGKCAPKVSTTQRKKKAGKGERKPERWLTLFLGGKRARMSLTSCL